MATLLYVRSLRPIRLPALVLAVVAGACDAGPPTFAADVAPLVYANCALCHRPDGPGPFSLLSYQDISSRAALIADVTGRRFMPPWLPRAGSEHFTNRRGLDDDEVALLAAWVEAGAPLGDPARVPDPPTWPSGWMMGPPDLVVEMPVPFTVPAEGEDVFRNFVIPIPIGERRFVAAIDLEPGNPRVVQHATMSLDATPASRIAARRDSLPGFDGMLSTSSARASSGFFVAWTPGRVLSMNPAGMTWTIEPGTDLVAQLHLRPNGQAEQVRAQVAFYFADEPPLTTPAVVRLGGQALDIPPGQADYAVEDELWLPVDVDVLALYPHAHYIGKSMDVRAVFPDGSERQLLDIPRWDFNWQDVYHFDDPVRLPAGTTLRLRYLYDNSADNPANPFDPPRRIVYGGGSTDEMAELHVQLVTPEPGDLPTLRRVLASKAAADQLEGWRHMLALDSEDAGAHFGLGTMAQSQGDLTGAVVRYRRAVAARPNFPQAHYNLGVALAEQGRDDEAVEAYREAVRWMPEYASAQTALGTALASRGDYNEAEQALQRALESDSTAADAHNSLGNVLRADGRIVAAIESYEAALRWRPGFQEAGFNLALALLDGGRVDEAIAALDVAARGNLEASAQPRLVMAWALATHPDPALRRPSEAVRMAELLAEMTGNGNAVVLDALAAGYAAEGDFEPAVGAARRAAAIAEAAGDARTAAEIRARAQLYLDGRPYVQPGG